LPLNFLDNLAKPNQPAGLYVHIPFCLRKCPYCDFYSVIDLSLKSAFTRALAREIDLLSVVSLTFDTLYIGGGTPSILEPKEIGEIIAKIRSSFKILPSSEITLEVNPGTVSPDRIKQYRRLGVNRLNIGVQSFQDTNLGFLKRIHTADDAIVTIQWARKAGFDNIGLDLMYGIPDQTEESWEFDLQRAIEFQPEHLSCYMLTYEAGTPLAQNLERGQFRPLEEGLVARLFETTVELLTLKGYAQYEISNFARAKPGKSGSNKSRHNQKYWSFAPYLGLGPSAHSFVDPVRCWNDRSVKKYITALEAGRLAMEAKEIISPEQRIIEAVYLGLRTTDGICVNTFNNKYNLNFYKVFGEVILDLEAKGLVESDKNRCFLSRKGMLFLDSIADIMLNVELEDTDRRL